MITKVVPGDRILVVALQATCEIFFNRLRRCLQKYQNGRELRKTLYINMMILNETKNYLDLCDMRRAFKRYRN